MLQRISSGKKTHSFTRRHPAGPALLRVLTPHLPAISGDQGRILRDTNETEVFQKIPENIKNR